MQASVSCAGPTHVKDGSEQNRRRVRVPRPQDVEQADHDSHGWYVGQSWKKVQSVN